MTELAFPIAATLTLVLVAIPAATLATRAALGLLRRWELVPGVGGGGSASDELREGGATLRYLLLVSPVVIPAIWLVSAVIHHAESDEAALTCLFEHVAEASCAEPLWAAMAIALLLMFAFYRHHRIATRAVTARRRANDPIAAARIAQASADHPQIGALANRIHVVEGHEFRTVGLLRPHIEVGADIVRSLGADALTGALLHECEHVQAWDPLRFVLVSVCRSLNPVGFLLEGEIARWRAGREVICDEAAVHHGADACSLAEALVAVAREPSAPEAHAAYLGHTPRRGDANNGAGTCRSGVGLLQIRVALLLGYTSSQPRCRCAPTVPAIAGLAMLALSALPHYWGEQIIVDLHQGAERAIIGSHGPQLAP